MIRAEIRFDSKDMWRTECFLSPASFSEFVMRQTRTVHIKDVKYVYPMKELKDEYENIQMVVIINQDEKLIFAGLMANVPAKYDYKLVLKDSFQYFNDCLVVTLDVEDNDD